MSVFLLAGIWQMISLAAFIALLVDRLTTPHSRIIFSNTAVLGTFNGQPALSFRLAHERRSVLLDAEAHLHSEEGLGIGCVRSRPIICSHALSLHSFSVPRLPDP